MIEYSEFCRWALQVGLTGLNLGVIEAISIGVGAPSGQPAKAKDTVIEARSRPAHCCAHEFLRKHIEVLFSR